MQTPNITLVQIISFLLAAIFPFLALIGVDLNDDQKDALTALTGLAAAAFLSDAGIRHGRSRQFLHPPQNITVLDPNAALADSAPARTGLVADAGDEDVVNSTDEPQPEGAVGEKPGAASRRIR